jgi:flagellar biosynthesis protein FlhG
MTRHDDQSPTQPTLPGLDPSPAPVSQTGVLTRGRSGLGAGDRPAPTIWAIGGGKGGVGKSAVAANLGVVLAQAGHMVSLVDVDLGGANLHTLLGIPSPPKTLSDFVGRRVERLEDVMAETGVPGLWLVSGARAVVEIANVRYATKERLLRHIRALPTQHVILDLGAGSTFNVLDFFLAARHGLIVVIPEATSVENAYHFLKAAFFRKLRRVEPRDRVRAAVNQAMAQRDAHAIRSPLDLINLVTERDPLAGDALMAEAEQFEPWLIINRISRPSHRRLGEDMSVACRDYFGRNIRCAAYVDEDELLARSIQDRRPAATEYPESQFVTSIRAMAERMASGEESTHGP